MDALLATFTVPGLGALARVTGMPPLFRRSYVTLVSCCPPGSASAMPTVPTPPDAAPGDEAPIPVVEFPPPLVPPPALCVPSAVSVLEQPTCTTPPVAQPSKPTRTVRRNAPLGENQFDFDMDKASC